MARLRLRIGHIFILRRLQQSSHECAGSGGRGEYETYEIERNIRKNRDFSFVSSFSVCFVLSLHLSELFTQVKNAVAFRDKLEDWNNALQSFGQQNFVHKEFEEAEKKIIKEV
jgi:hypothetical protein